MATTHDNIYQKHVYLLLLCENLYAFPVLITKFIVRVLHVIRVLSIRIPFCFIVALLIINNNDDDILNVKVCTISSMAFQITRTQEKRIR